MDTTNGLLTYLGQRIGAGGLLLLVVLLATVAIVVMAGLMYTVVNELIAASADPVQVAPVRWTSRT